jgi:diaminopimelate epimerase
MREITFYKYQGTGNDFIIIDQMETQMDFTTDEIHFMCDRRKGIGADGLILLRPSSFANFKMVYYNSDGNESTMCGNGGRCVSRLFYKLFPEIGNRFNFQAIDGHHSVKILEDGRVSLEMRNVGRIKQGNKYWELDTGSPHYVTIRNDLFSIDVNKEGSSIRYSQEYAKDGINVNFVDIEDDYIAVRTYERGVEGETLSCGTGVTAAALAADLYTNNKQGNSIEVHTKGGTLNVSFEKKGEVYQQIWLSGPALQVFTGNIQL